MTPAVAIARLAALGLPADKLEDAAAIIDDVIATAMVGEDERKAKDRARKAARKSEERSGRDRNSAEIHGSPRNGAERSGTETAVVVDNNPDNSEININTTTSLQQQRSQRVFRGTRLPDDFMPLPNILELALSRGFTEAEYWDHFQRFKDYWQALSGAKAAKLDWNATWRNRVKDLADKLKRTTVNGQAPRSSIAAKFDDIRASIEGGGEQGNLRGPENPGGLSRLRQGAA